MSSYVNFFVERKGVYIPIADYSRSNPMYQILSHMVPYENVTEFDEALYHSAIEEFDEKIEEYEKCIERYEREIAHIAKIEGPSFNEKLQYIAENEGGIEECKEEIEMLKAQKFTLGIIDRMRDKWSGVKVWVGVEVSERTLNNEPEE